LDWVNRTKANQPAFGYTLVDLPGNVIGAIRLSANDVEVTLSIGMLIDDILARIYLKIGDWITGTGAARASRTGASPGKQDRRLAGKAGPAPRRESRTGASPGKQDRRLAGK